MRKKFHRRSLLVGLVSVALAGATSIASATHSWNGYHWARTANPFTVKLGNNVSSAWTSYLNQASADWSSSDVLNTTVVAGQAKPRNCRPTSGRVEVCNATYGNTGWLGIASISITGGTHITAGTVKLNDTYFNTATYNSPSWRALVTCQEIGHTFGLDHQDTDFSNTNLGTCMDYTNNPLGPPDNEHPNKHDYDELDIIYAHLDSTNTISQPTADNFAADIDTNDPANWGQLVKASHGGRTAIYERDFGGGRKQVTFVIWALEGNRPQ
jgi:hypothetical protein